MDHEERIDLYISKETRVYVKIVTIAMTRQTCEVHLCCDNWDFSPVKSVWTLTFDGDRPNIFGASPLSDVGDMFRIKIDNGIRADHSKPSVLAWVVITAVCPIDKCATKIVLEVVVQTRKGACDPVKRELTLFENHTHA